MIVIYKDEAANAIFIQDANGVQFMNSLQATDDGTTCSVHDLAKDIDIVSNIDYSEFVDENGNGYGNNAIQVCNALNAIFAASGTSQTNLPVITSSLNVNMTQGDTLNYELTADYGVGYEWDLSNVSGVTTVDFNPRKLIGGSNLAVGTYNIPVRAINYNGNSDDTTQNPPQMRVLVLNVSQPPFSNTKSIRFLNQDYLGANAALLQNVLGRNGNGSGSGDAWTISLWYKASSATQGQTILYFGSQDTTNNGYIELRQVNNQGQKRLRLRYGSNNNRIQIITQSGSLVAGAWQHITVTYDGGTTGSASGSVNSYYSRFKIYINNVLQTVNNSNANYGWSGAITGQNFRIGRLVSGSHMRDANVDELAIWDSDQSANVSDIYNSGNPFDLMTLTDKPLHWWRMGDGDTYPNLQDNGTHANCVFIMYSMTAASIVNDVP